MIYDHEPFMLSIQFRIRREILDNDFYRFYKKRSEKYSFNNVLKWQKNAMKSIVTYYEN